MTLVFKKDTRPPGMEPALTAVSSCAGICLAGKAGRGSQSPRHEVFPEVARRSFPSTCAVTQAEAWTQALPGPVTQFPPFYRSITHSTRLAFHP